MSKIGKLPVDLPENVEVTFKDGVLSVKGPKGELERKIPFGIEILVQDGKAVVSSKSRTNQAIANWGSVRAHLANMVHGITEGWQKQLELEGAGYRAEIAGRDLKITAGQSHPTIFKGTDDINFKVEKNVISVEGQNKELVSQMAAQIRAVRPPDPYTGKGIKYSGEQVRRKPGKAAKGAEEGAAA